MAVGEGTIAGIPARVFRISFSGELAYEVAAPSRFGEEVWEAVLGAGREFGIAPYGLEAMGVLRIEKGHPAGHELGGLTTAADLGLARMVKKSGDFIGRVLAGRPAMADPRRPRLTGIRPIDKSQRLRGGAHLVSEPGSAGQPRLRHQRHALGRARAVDRPRAARGGRDLARQAPVGVSPLHDERVEVVVTSPCFVDPENARVRA